MKNLAFFFACAAVGLQICGPAEAKPKAGEEAPELVARTLDGATFDLSKLRGDVVVVNFWATWCGPCRREMPAFDAFFAKHGAQGFDMIGISDDKSRDRDDVAKIANTVSYPIALAYQADKDGFGHQSALPLTYVIDKQGIIRTIFTDDQSPITAQELDAAVTPLLQ